VAAPTHAAQPLPPPPTPPLLLPPPRTPPQPSLLQPPHARAHAPVTIAALAHASATAAAAAHAAASIAASAHTAIALVARPHAVVAVQPLDSKPTTPQLLLARKVHLELISEWEALAQAAATAASAPAAHRPVLIGYLPPACFAGASCRVSLPPSPLPLTARRAAAASRQSLLPRVPFNVVKHLFKCMILEGLVKPKKELVRGYLKAADNHSYDNQFGGVPGPPESAGLVARTGTLQVQALHFWRGPLAKQLVVVQHDMCGTADFVAVAAATATARVLPSYRSCSDSSPHSCPRCLRSWSPISS
jgi:hypothetical protein